MKRPGVSLRGNLFPARRSIARLLATLMLAQLIWQEAPLPRGIGVLHHSPVGSLLHGVANWDGRVLLADPVPAPLAVVRHAPILNGRTEGTVKQLNGENVTINGSAVITGDLFVPGTPTVKINGSPSYGGTQTGTGSAQPTGYMVTLNNGATLGHVVLRTDPLPMNSVPVPPASTGTRDVTVNTSGQNLGNFGTLRDLTLNSNTGSFNIPPGTYRRFTANSGSGFIFGVVGATQPSVYNLEELTLNSSGWLQVVGPVVINVANRATVNNGAVLGGATNANWMSLNVARYDVTINSGGVVYGAVQAPAGTVMINGRLQGTSTSDRLTVNSGGWFKAGISNQAPVVDAGPDQTIAFPGSANLAGTVSDDGLPAGSPLSLSWTMVSGPGSVAFSNPAAAVTTAGFTASGTYVLRLTVSDTQLSRSDEVMVTVNPPPPINQPPSVSAGSNQSITLPDTASLAGVVSDDGLPGGILTVMWSKVGGPGAVTFANPNATATAAGFSSAGTYVLQLTASDSVLSNSAAVTITVNPANQAPTVSAGANQTITLSGTANLSGVVNDDGLPAGGTLTVVWSKVSGSGTVTFANPYAPATTASFSLAGSYVLRLTASDSALSNSADIAITVSPANQAPTVSAGSEQTITLPNVASLSGTATDDGLPTGSTLALTWSQISGPGTVSFANPDAAVTTASFSAAGAYLLRLTANDSALSSSADVTITVGRANQAPTVSAGSDQTVTLPSLALLDGAASDDGLPLNAALTTLWTKVSGPGTVTFTNASMAATTASFSLAGDYVLRLTASDSALSSYVDVAITVNPAGPALPPDPATVAPALDRTVATSLAAATEFLYTGDNPVQTGVAPGTIRPKQATVIRGKVSTREGLPLSGVRITILHHPEFGSTLSRADGAFDMAANGGKITAVNYEKSGFIPIQRQVYAPWQDYTLLPDVVMAPFDTQVTHIDLNSGALFQVAQGSLVTDADGSRRATLLFSGGTAATMEMANGATQALSDLHVRATEYTIGPAGPATMPALLPVQSVYTYAVELSADEAVAAGANSIHFSQPVIQYVENFLGYPVGGIVPAGYYDRERAVWVPSANGRIIHILAIIDGLAVLDIDGSGTPASDAALAALGVSGAERQQLATLYQPGQSLWRVPITHFSAWDFNWGFGIPVGATLPNQPAPVVDNKDKLDKPCKASGSIVECQNQVLGEVVGVSGTPFSLHYQSDRVAGHNVNNTVKIPLSGSSVPSVLDRIELEIKIAGRLFTWSFRPEAFLSHTFTWDGQDAYGRTLQGVQTATVRVGYTYKGVIGNPGGFGNYGNGNIITGAQARVEATIWQQPWQVPLSFWDSGGQELGGWNLSVHHAYEPTSRMLYLGDGRWRRVQRVEKLNGTITTAAGNGSFGYGGDGGPAAQAQFRSPRGIAVASDGSVYIADTLNDRIRRVKTDGVIATVAGNGIRGYSGDNGPANQAQLNLPHRVAIGPDGCLYIADTSNHRIRRVGPDGIITTVAGTGTAGFGGDGGPASQARLNLAEGVAVGPDGTLYIADTSNHRVRRVTPDGIITTVAGKADPSSGNTGDGVLATQAPLPYPTAVSVGPDGRLYIVLGFNHQVRRVDSNGLIFTVAGTGDAGYSGDGGFPSQAGLNGASGVSVGPDGVVYVADSFNYRIRQVESVITTAAGSGSGGYEGDGGSATVAKLNVPWGVAVAPDGSLYIADTNNNRIRRVLPASAGGAVNDLLIAAEGGGEVYVFSDSGRHLRTLHPLTGAVLYHFGYDSEGRLVTITDGDGNITAIERAGAGPTGIVGPYGQRTALNLDANGYLATVTNPAGESVMLTYAGDGLLATLTDPASNVYRFSYDTTGRLLQDEDPAGGLQTLARTDLSNGYEATRTTGLNHTTSYRVQRLSNEDQVQTNTFPDGTQAVLTVGTHGTRSTSSSDGALTSCQEGPDPRWGLEAPLAQSQNLRTPAGRLLTTLATRSAVLADVNNPLSLTALSETVTINGRNYASVFNSSTRTFVSTSPAGRQAALTVNPLGRATQSQVAGIQPITFVYDSRGRLASTTQGTGVEARTSTFSYNSSGYLESVTDLLNRTARYEYDEAGRLVQQTLSDSRSIRYSYDVNGNLSSLTPPGRPEHGFRYTPVNLTSEYDPPSVGAGSYQTAYSYNGERQPTVILRPDGQTLSFNYDSAGRLSGLDLPQGEVSYSYNASTGNLASITAPDGGSLSFGYDGPLPTTTTWAGTVAGSVSRTYDNNLRTTSRSVNGASSTGFTYDSDSLLTGAGALTLNRNPQNGLLTGTALGSVTDSWSYDGFSEVASYTASFNGAPVYGASYNYDKLGRIVSKTETIQGITDTFAYGYDPAGRLETVSRNGQLSSSYNYDSNSNRQTRSSGTGTAIYGYDAQDRLTAWNLAPETWNLTYTVNGELQSKTNGSETATYQYDALGNLRHVGLPGGTTIDYVIDGQNHRVGKRVNGVLVQGWLYGNQLNPVAELDGNNAVVSIFVYGSRANVPDYLVKYGVTYRIIADHLGSPRLIIDSSTGNVVQRLDYDEFGNVLQDTNPGFQPFGFAGGLYDPQTKLTRFGARDYDAETGRWTAKDPILFDGGDTNLYGYVLSDPINAVDSSGYAGIDVSQFVSRNRRIRNSLPDFLPDFLLDAFLPVTPEDVGQALAGDLFGMVTPVAMVSSKFCKGPIVIGENMKDRVIPYAREIGADWYKPRSVLEDNWLRNNMRWLGEKIREGREVIDIGPDLNRPMRSPFYEAEKQLLEKTKYPVRVP